MSECVYVVSNAFIMSSATVIVRSGGEVSVFSLKVMVLFLGCVGVLLASPCIVFQRVCVLCLWSQCVSRYSLHMSDLCVCMRDVISDFNSWDRGITCVLCSDVVSVFYFCVLCVLGVVCIWSVSCLLGWCVCLRGEWCLWRWFLQCVCLVVVEC